ncbi:MAG: HEAT repeat domain-containing protein [Planctomycetota bacterium]
MKTLIKILVFLIIIAAVGAAGYWHWTKPDRLITELAGFAVPENPEKGVGSATISSLVNMGFIAANPMLKRFDQAPISAKVGIIIAAGQMLNPIHIPLFQKALGIEDAKLNEFASIALARFGLTYAKTVLKWIDSDPSPMVQEFACRALGRMDGKKTVELVTPELFKLLNHPNLKVQKQAIIGLIRFNKYLNKNDLTPLTNQVSKIVPFMESEDEEVANQASLAVIELRIPNEGGLEQIQYLKNLLKHTKAYVRLNTLNVLTTLFGSDVGIQDQVARALEDSDLGVRKNALQLMIQVGLTIHYEKVIPFLTSDDPEIHEKLVKYLGSISDPKLIEILAPHLISGSYQTQFTVIRILKGIGKIHDRKIYDPIILPLIECMKVNEPEIQKEDQKMRYFTHEALRLITRCENIAYSYTDWMEWYNIASTTEVKRKEAFQNLQDAKGLMASAQEYDPKKKNQMYREAIDKLKKAERLLEEIRRFSTFTFEEQFQDIQELKYQANKFMGND